MTLLRLPPVSEAANGTPEASVRMWCLEAARPRSTGLGPLWAAPSSPPVGGVDHRPGQVQLAGTV